MKKTFILLLVFILTLGLYACAPQETTDEPAYQEIGDYFVVIEKYGYDIRLVAAKDTGVVYLLDPYGNIGYLSPYLIYEDGAIYGAVWINDQITPIPFATE